MLQFSKLDVTASLYTELTREEKNYSVRITKTNYTTIALDDYASGGIYNLKRGLHIVTKVDAEDLSNISYPVVRKTYRHIARLELTFSHADDMIRLWQ